MGRCFFKRLLTLQVATMSNRTQNWAEDYLYALKLILCARPFWRRRRRRRKNWLQNWECLDDEWFDAISDMKHSKETIKRFFFAKLALWKHTSQVWRHNTCMQFTIQIVSNHFVPDAPDMQPRFRLIHVQFQNLYHELHKKLAKAEKKPFSTRLCELSAKHKNHAQLFNQRMLCAKQSLSLIQFQ